MSLVSTTTLTGTVQSGDSSLSSPTKGVLSVSLRSKYLPKDTLQQGVGSPVCLPLPFLWSLVCSWTVVPTKVLSGPRKGK